MYFSSSKSSSSSWSSSPGNLHSKNGMDWQNKIFFDPEVDPLLKPLVQNGYRGHGFDISAEELRTKLRRLIDESEEIEVIWYYKNPLNSWQFTQFVFYHAFIVLKTTSWYWSLEKNCEGITIQRSKKFGVVRDRYRGTDRLKPVQVIDSDSGHLKMGDLIDWLYSEGEVLKTYHALDSNCKTFANSVFAHFATTKTT